MREVRLEFPGVLDRNLLVSMGVEKQHRDFQGGHRSPQVVLGQDLSQRLGISLEAEGAGLKPALKPAGARGADGDHGLGADRGGRDQGQVTAHARPAEGDRLVEPNSIAQQFRHKGDVSQHPAVQRGAAVSVTTLVERQRGKTDRQQRTGEVVVALLARAGTMQDHHPSPDPLLSWEPERVGQPVADRDLGRKHGDDGA